MSQSMYVDFRTSFCCATFHTSTGLHSLTHSHLRGSFVSSRLACVTYSYSLALPSSSPLPPVCCPCRSWLPPFVSLRLGSLPRIFAVQGTRDERIPNKRPKASLSEYTSSRLDIIISRSICLAMSAFLPLAKDGMNPESEAGMLPFLHRQVPTPRRMTAMPSSPCVTRKAVCAT